MANALSVAYDARWFKHATRVVLDVLALIATDGLSTVFPFDFGSAALNEWARIALLALLLLGVAIVAELVRLAAGPRGD